MPKPTHLEPSDAPLFATWDNAEGREIVLAQMGHALARVEPVRRAVGSDIFNNIAPNNVSVRDGFNRYDYETFRLGEARPTRSRDQILAAMRMYEDNGLVYNIINLMADFATKGVGLIHQNERVEGWWKEWFRRVRGPQVSERFVNYLCRCGVALPKRQTASISVKIEQEMKRAGAADIDAAEDYAPVYAKREIPWDYTFLNPLSIAVIAEDLSTLVGQDWFQFSLIVPGLLANRIRNPKPGDGPIISAIPNDIKALILSGHNTIPLDPKKVSAYYYKRDDWRAWAMPMVAPILKDLNMLEKMKLADLSALDGAISCIRVWKLGNLDARILPTEAAISRLAQMLQNNVGGGVMDLVWGPEIELIETSTEVHRFLGESKYGPVLRAVYQGLGIPSAVSGAEKSGGFNADFFSLRVLVDRMEYVRSVLRDFWEYEIRLAQKAMGFRFPAQLVFDHMDLSDPASQKQIWLNMADRDMISWETLVRRFGEDPDVEAARLRREMRRRQNGQMPPKASPFHDPQQDYGLKKIFAQLGAVTPTEVGLTLDDPKKGEETPAEHKAALQPKPLPDERKGQPGQGRPVNAKDSAKRKQKVVKPRTSVAYLEALGWAENAQARLHQFAGEAYLKALGKSNFREVSADQARAFEDFKFRALFRLPYGEEVGKEAVRRAVAGELDVPSIPLSLLKASLANHVEKTGREPTLEIARRFQSGVYALWRADEGTDP